MTHGRWTLGALAVATLSLGLPGSPSPAVAEPLDSSVRLRLDGVAAEIERVSDEIMVKGHTAATDVEIRGRSAAALSAYFDSLRMERRSMEQNGGVTVLATTARIEALPGTSAGSPISAELHVTRTVAELPTGELWEEVLPISLTAEPDGSLTVTGIGTQQWPAQAPAADASADRTDSAHA